MFYLALMFDYTKNTYFYQPFKEIMGIRLSHFYPLHILHFSLFLDLLVWKLFAIVINLWISLFVFNNFNNKSSKNNVNLRCRSSFFMALHFTFLQFSKYFQQSHLISQHPHKISPGNTNLIVLLTFLYLFHICSGKINMFSVSIKLLLFF